MHPRSNIYFRVEQYHCVLYNQAIVAQIFQPKFVLKYMYTLSKGTEVVFLKKKAE
jgi:hypothetical protein